MHSAPRAQRRYGSATSSSRGAPDDTQLAATTPRLGAAFSTLSASVTPLAGAAACCGPHRAPGAAAAQSPKAQRTRNTPSPSGDGPPWWPKSERPASQYAGVQSHATQRSAGTANAAASAGQKVEEREEREASLAALSSQLLRQSGTHFRRG